MARNVARKKDAKPSENERSKLEKSPKSPSGTPQIVPMPRPRFAGLFVAVVMLVKLRAPSLS